jgi:hypothetical protein
LKAATEKLISATPRMVLAITGLKMLPLANSPKAFRTSQNKSMTGMVMKTATVKTMLNIPGISPLMPYDSMVLEKEYVPWKGL